MFRFIKSVLATAAAILISFAARADEVSFDVNVKMIVAQGEAFRVEFSLNAKPDRDSFTAPDFNGFDILAGPATSDGQSVQIINGKMTKSVSHTITYVLLPQSSGTFTIGAASVKVDGKRYATRPTQIEVRDNDAQGSAQPGNSERRDNASSQSQAEGQISNEDLLLRLTLSRADVYKGEPVRASLNLYNRVNLADYAIQKMPSFNGFWTQQLEADSRPRRETYNGKVYEVYTLADYLLYPQQAGRLVIDPVEMTALVQVIVQSGNHFDPFFGGREVYNIKRNLSTPRMTVNVKELPAGAPASFTGAVGRFTVEGAPSAVSLAANSAATYTLKISGAGNLAFIQAPKLNLPSSFEQYQVKSSEKLSSTGSGTTGSRTFEYPFIARAEGEYTIPAAEFSYFDSEHKRYVTIAAEAFTLDIAPDTAAGAAPQVLSGPSREDVRLLGSDIRFIKLGKPSLHKARRPAIFSPCYFVTVLCMLAAALCAYVLLNRHRKERRNMAVVRGKRANKVAVQRFRTAEKHMKNGDKNGFYEEMLKALWGYMSDKFNIPVSNLTKENVREELQKRGISSDAARHFTDIISQCDEAQYSPAASMQMNEVYIEGINIVSQIETTIKK